MQQISQASNVNDSYSLGHLSRLLFFSFLGQNLAVQPILGWNCGNPFQFSMHWDCKHAQPCLPFRSPFVEKVQEIKPWFALFQLQNYDMQSSPCFFTNTPDKNIPFPKNSCVSSHLGFLLVVGGFAGCFRCCLLAYFNCQNLSSSSADPCLPLPTLFMPSKDRVTP